MAAQETSRIKPKKGGKPPKIRLRHQNGSKSYFEFRRISGQVEVNLAAREESRLARAEQVRPWLLELPLRPTGTTSHPKTIPATHEKLPGTIR